MRIYVACLASYNNGVLHGRWIDASDDTGEMQGEINAMLRESRFPNVQYQEYLDDDGDKHRRQVPLSSPVPDDWAAQGEPYHSAEEWAIHDSEGLGDLQEYASLDTIASRVAIAEVADDFDVPLSIVLEAMSDAGADDVSDFMQDKFIRKADTWKDFAEEWCEEVNSEELDKLPDWLRNRIDWDGVARDFECGGDFNAYREGEYGDLYFFYS